MQVMIDICAGNEKKDPTKKDIQKNIDALKKLLSHTSETVLLLDSISILKSIQDKLPEYQEEECHGIL